MNIEINKDKTKGAAIAKAGADNKQIGEMTFSVASDNLIIIDHTEVNQDHRGEGIGEKLLDKVVAWARENDVKIMPLCPFANAQFKENDQIQDVLKK
ncbi:GNAT family N-acetyltransferase [Flavobacteriaceae bacterium Ap0902]|nr:GNAT family N-acetyltransferase [Flavobacteriaceae bacterium Ap0902]